MRSPDNPPAFPRPISEDRTNGDLPDGNDMISDQKGMTLRDFFAAQGLAGLLAAHAAKHVVPAPENAARMVYDYADALLAERSKPAPKKGGAGDGE